MTENTYLHRIEHKASRATCLHAPEKYTDKFNNKRNTVFFMSSRLFEQWQIVLSSPKNVKHIIDQIGLISVAYVVSTEKEEGKERRNVWQQES